MRSRKPLSFETIPEWAIDGETRDRHTVAAAFELASLSGKWVRLTADTQRAVFGHNLFGKCQFKVNDEGIRATRVVCFGTDFSDVILNWSEVERCMKTGRRPCF